MTLQLSLLSAQSERERILAAIAADPAHKVYLSFVRPVARELAQRNGTVTIDDVRAEMQRRDMPMPAEVGIDERVFGTLFRCKEFIAISQRPTTRRERIARAGVGASFVTVYKAVAA